MKFQPFSFWWKKITDNYFFFVFIGVLFLIRYFTGRLVLPEWLFLIPIVLFIFGLFIPAFTSGLFEKIYDRDIEEWIETGDPKKGRAWRYAITVGIMMSLLSPLSFAVLIFLTADLSGVWLFVASAIFFSIGGYFIKKWQERKKVEM